MGLRGGRRTLQACALPPLAQIVTTATWKRHGRDDRLEVDPCSALEARIISPLDRRRERIDVELAESSPSRHEHMFALPDFIGAAAGDYLRVSGSGWQRSAGTLRDQASTGSSADSSAPSQVDLANLGEDERSPE
jgi:hypothetical protein